jgi:hypothetical protein
MQLIAISLLRNRKVDGKKTVGKKMFGPRGLADFAHHALASVYSPLILFSCHSDRPPFNLARAQWRLAPMRFQRRLAALSNA